MFCDLAGFTEMSRRLDPEELRHVVAAHQERFRRTINAFDGFIARYMGDGLLAYFGFPVAHEDDADRALYTALRVVQESKGLRDENNHMPVRVGIATGIVVVGDQIGSGQSAESLAVGEAPNLAARLQALADPDSVLVSDSTRLLCGDRFQFEDRGTNALKGFEQPVRCWKVVDAPAARTRFRTSRAPLSPLVGRDAELSVIQGHWQHARRGEGQVVVLQGDPGIGKSRVAETLMASMADESDVSICCQCSPHHEHTPLFPFRQELERSAGTGIHDDPEIRAAKLRALLSRRDASGAVEFGPLAALLSIPGPEAVAAVALPPLQLRQKTLRAWIDMVLSHAKRQTLLVLVEDLHWVDPTSMELLELLAHGIADQPVLLLVTTRALPQAAWLQAPGIRVIRIERLSDVDAASLAVAQAGSQALSKARIEEVVAKTDGVPLFIEEFVRTMTGPMQPDQRVTLTNQPLVPESLQDSLMARLDRLGTGKDVAQVASVIGRRFPQNLVAELLPLGPRELHDALGALCDAAVLRRVSKDEQEEYLFHHALLRDAAYLTLLHSRRRELHSRVAEAMARLYPELAKTQPEVLALHFAQSAQPFQAARHLAVAALRDLNRSSNLECLAHATEALEQLSFAGDQPGRELLEAKLCILRGAVMRAVRSFSSSEAEACFRQALAIGENLGDETLLIDVHRGLFAVHYARGQLAQAQMHSEHVLALAVRTSDRASHMLGTWMLGCVAFWQGDFDSAHANLARAVALYDPEEQKSRTLAVQVDPGVNAQCHMGWLLWLLGKPGDAIAVGDRAIANARALGQPLAIAMSLFFACATRACCGMFRAMKPLLDEAKAITAEHRLGYMASCARVLDAQALIAEDRSEEGLQQVELALAEFRAQEAGIGTPWSMAIAATGWLRLGRVDKGLAAIDGAFAAMQRNGERHWEPELWRLRGQLLSLRDPDGEAAEVDRCLGRSLEAARRQSAVSLELRVAMASAQIRMERGEKVSPAREALEAALQRIEQGFETADLVEARRSMDVLRLKDDR